MLLLTTTRFDRDLRRAGRRGKDLSKLWAVVERLLSRQPLGPRSRPHRLSGDLSDYWECHVESDWLLVWGRQDDAVVLVRTGTHDDLFG